MLIVQRKTAGEVVTFTKVVGEFTLEIVAAPLITVHVPVSPPPTAFALIVNELLPQIDWSEPAFAVVVTVLVKVTVSKAGVMQPGVVIVHFKVTGEPVTVTAVVGELMLAIVAVPLTMLHVPVEPCGGAEADIVKLALLH